MIKKSISYLVLLVCSSCSFSLSQSNIDVYGVDHSAKTKIIKHCSIYVSQYVEYVSSLGLMERTLSEADEDAIKKRLDKAISCINKTNEYVYTNISPINYFNPRKTYTTVDIVLKTESYRIPNKLRTIDLNLVVNDDLKKLFTRWKKYNESNVSKLSNNKFSYKNKSCPVDHCTWGFSEYERKEYLNYFIKYSNRYHNELKEIISKSNDDALRAVAVFVLANSSQSSENAEFLSSFINDKSSLVRNNVMRVIAAIYKKHPSVPVSIVKLCKAVNYPDATDRNKAAISLLNIAQNNSDKARLIIKSCGNNFIRLLELKQPNNHDVAYQLLKESSHKNYGEHDYASWSKWIKEQQSLSK